MRLCGRAGVSLIFLELSLTGSAEAHVPVKTSSSAAGTTPASAPAEIGLQFREPIAASVSHISGETNGAHAVAAGAAAADASNKTALVLRLPAPLKPGADKVDWRALSADTPTVQRSFTFQVRP